MLLLALPIAGSASAMLLDAPLAAVPLASGRTPHPTIEIMGDADLCAPGSGVVNCGSADGASWATAYRIKGWEIPATTTVPALSMEGVTKHVIITGNTFRAHADGTVMTVRLSGNTHVAFESNLVSATGAPGLVLEHTNAPHRVTGNTFTQHAPGTGAHALVTVFDAPDLLVAENVLGAASDAWNAASELVRVDVSDGVTLDGNRYGPLNGTGLHVVESTGVTSTNETYNTTRTGIVAEWSDDLNVTDVTMDQVLDGVRVYESAGVGVTASSIKDNFPCSPSCEGTGIYGWNSELILDGVLVESFDDGIVLVDSSSGTSADAYDSADGASSGATLKGRYLTLQGNENGVQVFGGTKVMLKWSNFEGNGVGLRNNGGRVVGAAHNWWGCSAGPGASGCDSVVGDVDWTPPSSSRFPSG